jgi:tetratricopeptide (TPR) repeat protein
MAEIESAMADYGVDDGILAAGLSVRSKLGPYFRKATPAVSLCMIVRDEQDYLARCLHSAKPAVDEIIVADTGSGDRSPDIARVFGARVFDLPWENDFAKARNAALAQAQGDWIFVLDGDEVLSVRDHRLLRQIVEEPAARKAAYSIQTRNYTYHANTLAWRANDGSYPDEEQGVGWFPSDKVRLFPNHAGVRFSFPVHELVEPVLKELGIPIRSCPIPVHHYGKLKEAKTLEKTRGYRVLGEKKLGSLPTDAAALRELAIQSSHLNRHAEAMELWQKYLELEPQSAEAYLNLGSACWQLGRYTEARKHAQCAQRFKPSMKEASFNRGLAELMLGKAAAAARILERLLKKDPGYLPAGFTLAAAYACCGKTGKALAALQPIQSTALGAHLAESFYELAKRLRDASLGGYCEKLLKLAGAAGYRDARFEDLLRPDGRQAC